MKVVVVGAGVVGLCCAHELARRGAEVTLIERDMCGEAASSGNGGWIVPSLSTPIPGPGVFSKALRWMFEPDSPFFIRPRPSLSLLAWCWKFWRAGSDPRWRAGTAALLRLNTRTLELYDQLRDDGVAFEMHQAGLVFAARTASGLKSLREQFELMKESGWPGRIEEWSHDRVLQEEPALADTLAGVLFAADERHVRPESLVRGLAEALRAAGVAVVEHAEVSKITRRDGVWLTEAAGETHAADCAVIAAGAWTAPIVSRLGIRLPVQAAKGYSVTANSTGTIPRHPLYLEEAKIGVSPFNDGTRLAGTLELSGIDLHLNNRRLTALLEGAAPYLRDWQPRDPRVEWAGLRPLAPDGLPVIGELPGLDGLYVATGHGTVGVTLAPATAALLTSRVLDGISSPELGPFSPARF